MSLNSDFNKILHSFNSIKQDLNEKTHTKLPLTPNEAHDLISARELQLMTVIEISEKLIRQFEAYQLHTSSNSSGPPTENLELKDKFQVLFNSFKLAEQTIKNNKAEILHLKNEIQRLSTTQHDSNFFSLEFYQSEIEDIKKLHEKEIAELQSKSYSDEIHSLKTSNIQKNFSELLNKYTASKEQLSVCQKKISELEDTVSRNNEMKKVTEKKYSELVIAHKKMFTYIEKLEVKIKEYQEKHRAKRNLTLDAISREHSSCMKFSDEYKTFKLSIAGPFMVFSV